MHRDRVGCPATEIQGKLAQQRTDLDQGVLLPLALPDSPVQLGRLEKDHGQEREAEQAGAGRRDAEQCQQQPGQRQGGQRAARSAPSAWGGQSWESHTSTK